MRNVATLLRPRLASKAGPEIWLNATAVGFDVAPDGRLRSVVAQAPSGRRITSTAAEVVVAAGALESTRLLLLLDRQHEHRFFAPDGQLGRYLHDHLSAVVGTVATRERARLNRVAGFRFEGGGMRNLRFEPAPSPDVRALLDPCFVQLVFTSAPGTGFDALRELFRKLQQRRPPDAATLVRLARATPWLARAAWWRANEKRLLYPSDALIELNVVIEQTPLAHNAITLSPDRHDRFGQPLASISWSPAAADIGRLERTAALFVEYWRASTMAALGELKLEPRARWESALASSGGVYHPGGTTRMATSASQGVVSGDLASFAIRNLSVAATSVFPTSNGSNPTMALMMMALRLSERLANQAH